MNSINWWFLLPVLFAGAISMALVFCRAYDDGLFGRTALSALALASLSITVSEFIGGQPYEVAPEILVFVWAVALFLARHLLRVWWFSYFKECMSKKQPST